MKDMSNAPGPQGNNGSDQERVVKINSLVTVHELGNEYSYQIVEPHEVDVPNRRISKLSPVAKALLGKRVGDKVVVQAPGGDFEFEIREIQTDNGWRSFAGQRRARARRYERRTTVGVA